VTRGIASRLRISSCGFWIKPSEYWRIWIRVMKRFLGNSDCLRFHGKVSYGLQHRGQRVKQDLDRTRSRLFICLMVENPPVRRSTDYGGVISAASPWKGEMSIAPDATRTCGAVRSGGTQLGGYSSSIIPSLRTTKGYLLCPSYKHLTPTE
jgi:hypothetical protein